MTDLNATNEQAEANPAGASAEALRGTENGSGGQTQTTAGGPEEDSFFDPQAIVDKPELLSAYKQMQKAFTKKTQAVKASTQKIEAYDRFVASPLETMQQLAAQYGYRVVQTAEGKQGDDWNPQTWDDVMSEAEKRVLKKMQPVYNELRDLKRRNIETYLDGQHPDWRTYEDDMMGVLKEHPSLVNDPDKLYRLAVPDEVLSARATKAALAKLKTAGEHSSVSGGSRTTKDTTQEIGGPLSFAQAVEVAKKRLAKDGIRGIAG